jgi:hypothetical protein
MKVKFEGVIRGGKSVVRLLVSSDEGYFYVWNTFLDKSQELRRLGSLDVLEGELELAKENDIYVGHGLGAENGIFESVTQRVTYVGVVSGGKVSKRVLVFCDGGYRTAVVPVEALVGVVSGSEIEVDSRTLAVARDDQVAAGMGSGKLRRNRLVHVE